MSDTTYCKTNRSMSKSQEYTAVAVSTVAINPKTFNLAAAQECSAKKYTDAGWTVVMTNGGINDFVAGKADRFHFVQVVMDETDMKYHGLSKNSFIQNAFSNNAIPVYAYVRVVTGNNSRAEIRLEDVNTRSRLIVGGGKKTVTPTVNPTVKPTVNPTVKPTVKPTVNPTVKPTTKITKKVKVKTSSANKK